MSGTNLVVDSATYASSVALLIQEYTSIIAACPDPVFEMVSCHFSASCWTMKRSTWTLLSSVDGIMTDGIGTPGEVRVQGFGFDEAEGGCHGPPLSFVHLPLAQSERFDSMRYEKSGLTCSRDKAIIHECRELFPNEGWFLVQMTRSLEDVTDGLGISDP
jgi:hypothetical protein